MLRRRSFLFGLLTGLGLAFAGAAPAGEMESSFNGLDGYSIYHAPDAPPSVKEAVKELRTYVERASTVKLPVVTAPASPMFVVGDTPEGRAAGLTPENLSYSEYAIRTVGRDLHIVGRDLPEDGFTPLGGHSFGTLWGVYAFLRDALDVRWLLPGPLGEDVPPLPADWTPPELDLRGKPFFRSLQLFPAIKGCPPVFLQRNGYHPKGAVSLERPRHSRHSWTMLYPAAAKNKNGVLKSREDTYRDNPEFFALSSNGNRIMPPSGEFFSLCLSAPGIVEDIANRILSLSRAEPTLKVFPISANDGSPNCACKPCMAGFEVLTPERTGELARSAGHSASPLMLAYYRKVCELVKAADPELILTGYIYQTTEFAPSKPPPPMPDNFIADFAPLFTGYGPVRLYDGVNRSWRKWLEGWRGVFPHKAYYCLDFWLRQSAGAPTSPYPEMLRETFDYFREEGFTGFLLYPNEGLGRSAVNLWVTLRMIDDPSRDPSALMDEFFRRAYGEAAAKPVRALYDLCEAGIKRHYTEKKSYDIGYDLSVAILAGAYAPHFAEIERLYRDALPGADTPAREWRLSMLGENLKLLRYHLECMGLVPEAPDSPLYLGDAGYLEFDKRRRRGGDLYGYVDAAIEPDALGDVLQPLAKVEPVEAPAKIRTSRPAFGNRYIRNQDFLVRAPADMAVVMTLKYDDPKSPHFGKAFPYYSVYDAAGELHARGIVLKGELRFDAKKDQHYFVVYTPGGKGEWDDTWRVAACNVPFAVGSGEKVSVYGGVVLRGKGAYYFEVPEGLPSLSFQVRGQTHTLSIVNPKGEKTEIKGRGYQTKALDAPAGGWWRLDYDIPSHYTYIRSPELPGGFWCPEPKQALSVTLAKK